jgi:hypothetical protein
MTWHGCSDLNEELGLIEHVFADKTGTLTDNVMRFRKVSVRGVVYDSDGESSLEPATSQLNDDGLVDTFVALAICNTVQVRSAMPREKKGQKTPHYHHTTRARTHTHFLASLLRLRPCLDRIPTMQNLFTSRAHALTRLSAGAHLGGNRPLVSPLRG